MFYYTYLIYVNDPKSSLYGCIYYGQHRTNNLLDGYICSSKILSKKWLKRHPNGYYRKILQLYNSDEELNRAEYELIHQHLGQPYCLNLIDGGQFGRLHPDIYKAMGPKISKTMKVYYEDPINKEKQSQKSKEAWNNEERRKTQSQKMKDYYNNHPEACEEISKKEKEYYISHPEACVEISKRTSGKNNPMYGKNYIDYMSPEAIKEKGEKQRKQITDRRFLNNGIDCVLVKPDAVDYYISKGYTFGKLQQKRKPK